MLHSPDWHLFVLEDFNTTGGVASPPNSAVVCHHAYSLHLHFGPELWQNPRCIQGSEPTPPPGKLDHNFIHLLPTYRQKVKCESEKESFESTDWHLFYDAWSDLRKLTDIITYYIKVFEDTVITAMTVKVWGNNKLWLSKDLKVR